MGRVRVDITMSLDGFVAAHGVGLDAPLGAGTRLFDRLGDSVTTLERTRVSVSPFATHLRFAMRKEQLG